MEKRQFIKDLVLTSIAMPIGFSGMAKAFETIRKNHLPHLQRTMHFGSRFVNNTSSSLTILI